MPNEFSDHSWCAAALGKGLSAYCASRGLDMASAAQGVGLDPRVFDEGKERISIERFGAMLLDLVAASGDEAFGLAAAEAYALGDSGPLGFAMMNAPNLGEMWCLYSEISELAIEQTNYSFIEADGDLVNLHAYSPLMRHHDVFQDYTVTIFIRHIRVHAGPDWMPVKIELERPAPRNPRRGGGYSASKSSLVSMSARPIFAPAT